MNAPAFITAPVIHADSEWDVSDVWCEQFDDDATTAVLHFVHAEVDGSNERHETIKVMWPEIYVMTVDGPLGKATYNAEWTRKLLTDAVCDRLEANHYERINEVS